MSKLVEFIKKSYIFIILIVFYVPLFIGAAFSFQTAPRRGSINDYDINFTTQGWKNLVEDQENLRAIFTSLIIGLLVATIVMIVSLITVYGLWRTKSKIAKASVIGSSNIPLINPDVITGISLSLCFGLFFGVLHRGDNGFERVIIGHVVMILPFGITIMYPRSDKFKVSIMEASKDLGYGPIRTWFKTYFIHMIGVSIIVFLISIAMSFDDFIITKTVSRVNTISKKMYAGNHLRPWALALGTILMAITLSSTFLITLFTFLKERKFKKEVSHA